MSTQSTDLIANPNTEEKAFASRNSKLMRQVSALQEGKQFGALYKPQNPSRLYHKAADIAMPDSDMSQEQDAYNSKTSEIVVGVPRINLKSRNGQMRNMHTEVQESSKLNPVKNMWTTNKDFNSSKDFSKTVKHASQSSHK